MYDKKKEVTISGKKWFAHLWKEKGWEKGEAVTMVEFQCRRKILRMMQIETIEDLCFGNTIGVSRLKQMQARKDILERNLRGYVFSLAALAMKSMPGSDMAYGKSYVTYFLESVIEDRSFEQEVQKRKHKYDSMEY